MDVFLSGIYNIVELPAFSSAKAQPADIAADLVTNKGENWISSLVKVAFCHDNPHKKQKFFTH
jgi:hypothetical protein